MHTCTYTHTHVLSSVLVKTNECLSARDTDPAMEEHQTSRHSMGTNERHFPVDTENISVRAQNAVVTHS